ncbi:MAG TPA: hypothetical protein VGS22_10415 [Thermoanaerobaculia bacterium]|jgi:hypothetical protein|nr:hypothetical protein [Thermoanaerobaculia bacterium]
MKIQARHGSRYRCLVGNLAFLFAALLAVGSVEAQPFHRSYGRVDQFGGLTSVAPTQAPGAIASGYFNLDYTQGVLLKVQPDGTLAWVKAYGETLPSAVRQTAAGTFVWTGIGHLGLPPRFAPIVVEVDPTGAVLWSRAIDFPLPDGTPADQAYGRFLEIDPKDGGYWIGGEIWRQAFTDSEPWVAKLDRSGTLLWAKIMSFPESARFLSIFPALDGGVIGVGQIWLKNAVGALESRMLAVKLQADGSLDWAFRHLVHNADQGRSWQWLADLDRDPRFTRKESAVVGTVTNFCKSIPSVPCDPVRSAALVATLDETTGMLTQSVGLFSLVQPATSGETIAMDLTQEVNAVGGEVQGDELESREGLLTLLGAGNRVPRTAMLYGDGSGPFAADLGSLALYRNAPDRGYLFLMNEIDWSAPSSTLRRDLVQTDLAGKSGACESKTAVATFEAYLDRFGVQPAPRDGKQAEISLEAVPAEIPDEPCKSCPPERGARTEQSTKPGASASKAFPTTLLPGIPGAPEGRRADTPLLVLPLKPGVEK